MEKILNFEEINNMVDILSKKIKENNKFKTIALIGDLGTGKTHIVKRICKNLGLKENVKSPTFTYVIEYDVDNLHISHYDVYRLNNEDELYEIGFDENLGLDNNIYLIEWANNVIDALPDNTLYISLKYENIESRYVSIYELKKGIKEYVDINSYNFN